MSMSKKHYIQFAEMIAERKSITQRQFTIDANYTAQIVLDFIQSDMIRLFQSDNPNFDVDRFNDYIEKRINELSHQ